MASSVAERGTIYLGDIEINGYLLPNGNYCLAGRNVTDAIGAQNKTLTRYFNASSLLDLPNSDKTLRQKSVDPGLKALPGKALSLSQVKSNTGEVFIPVDIEDAMEYWIDMISKGNSKARALVKALALESLESRLDSVFGIKRSQEEKDAKLKARLVGKVTRRTWTDAIQAYLFRHPEKSDSYHDYIYIRVSDRLNVLVFGMTAKQLREKRNTTATLLRDTHSAEELHLIEKIEGHAMKLIDKIDTEPMAAIDEAYEFYS